MARYLSSRGYHCYSLSDVVRAEVARSGLDTRREHLVRIGNDLRRREGPGALAERLLRSLSLPAVIDSVRNPGEVMILRRLSGFFLLAVDSPAELRFARIRARGRLGDINTAEEFQEFEDRENSGVPSEQRIAATMRLADGTVLNDSDLEALHQRVDRALGGLPAA